MNNGECMPERNDVSAEAVGKILTASSDTVSSTVSFIDMLTAGTFIATALMLILAITTVVKEIQVRKINKRLEEIDKKYRSSIKKIDTAVLVEEICGAFIKDLNIDRISDYQKVKVNLNRLVFAKDSDQVQRAMLTLNNYISPFHLEFSEMLKYFYIQLWLDGEVHDIDLQDWFVREFRDSFYEDVSKLRVNSNRSR